MDATWFILKSSWAYMVHYDASPQRSKFKPYPLLEYACYQVWECALELVQRNISLKSKISKHLTSTSAEGLSSDETASKFSIWWFCHRMELPESFLVMTLLDLLGSTELQHKMPSWNSLYSITSIYNGTLLIDAAGAGESRVVRLLLDMRPIKENLLYLDMALRRASSKPSDIFEPYQSIIERGSNTTVLTELLEVGANLNGVGLSGDAAIHLAATHGHIDIVTFLTERQELHLDNPNGKGETPLLLASMHSHTDVVALLLGLSGSVSHRGDEEGRTPLSWAATRGNKALFDLLHRDQNVDVSKADCHGRTPLIWASIAGQEDFIKSLLSDPRVEPNLRDHLGRNPVSWTAWGGHYHLLETLWPDTRVTKYPRDYEGRDLLSYACDQGHTSLVSELLSTLDLDINKPDYYQRTPLIWARLRGHYDIEKLLLDDLRVLDLDQETAPGLVTTSIHYPDKYI
ncbi:ankyrin 23 unc44 [Fusarium acutatum]|uniref:Ankyrin 23 unc44 n=1 Tax=Fusarium acutatum TaxID=78861 RepID=A0A8H4JF59_9HYPO|nr:ankyrin 23 unc44 [Fusarium acutatum]